RAGATTSFAILTDHSVVGWGANVFGALGNNSLHNFNGPTKIPELRNVKLLVAGGNRGMAIAEPPRRSPLRADGNDDSGQLGPFTSRESSPPAGLDHPRSVGAGWRHSLAVAEDGTVWAWGDNEHGQLGNGTTKSSRDPVRVAALRDVAAVAGGEKHSVALRS